MLVYVFLQRLSPSSVLFKPHKSEEPLPEKKETKRDKELDMAEEKRSREKKEKKEGERAGEDRRRRRTI